MTRGGARTTGMVLPHNTSGLNGITFTWWQRKKGGRLVGRTTLHVKVAVRERRYARSADEHGDLGALRLVIELRQAEGLPAPTLRAASKALRAFRAMTHG
ncbi:MAG: hypothetical protein ABI605_11075 [Rhizobacter sp.]